MLIKGMWSGATALCSKSWKIPHVWQYSLARSCDPTDVEDRATGPQLSRIVSCERHKMRKRRCGVFGYYMLSLVKLSTCRYEAYHILTVVVQLRTGESLTASRPVCRHLIIVISTDLFGIGLLWRDLGIH